MQVWEHGAGRLDKSNTWMCHAQSLVCLSLERGWGVSSENKVVEEQRIERASPRPPPVNGTLENKYTPSAEETSLHSHCVVVAEAFDCKAKCMTSKAWLDHKAWKTGVQAILILGILEKKVSFIHICAYQNEGNKGDEDGRPPTNHWAAFLQANGRGSVRLDMIPGDGADGLTGMLVIESKTYGFTYNATQRVSFATLGQLTVQTITDLVSQLGRD
ncbi:conserved hypothetical protein [Histoplasma capsulatum H143]|uniref:DUF7770 domain-containing protein n=1 Tax=Ajellomyces capsulatus (strain H143) TaxID=544712 RepID=C6HLJ8_AJECH|nr:conserved hypothetical protein [Histoplasma capsulatum H143]